MTTKTTTVVPVTRTMVSDCRGNDHVVATQQIVTELADSSGVTSSVANNIETVSSQVARSTVVVARDVVSSLVAQQGPPGTNGTDGTGQHTFAFSWGDATPAALMTVTAGQMVLAVTISLDVPFNGVGASLSVGDAGDAGGLLDANMVDPTVIGAFQNAPCVRYITDTQVRLTIVPGTGASAGSGVISLYLE